MGQDVTGEERERLNVLLDKVEAAWVRPHVDALLKHHRGAILPSVDLMLRLMIAKAEAEKRLAEVTDQDQVEALLEFADNVDRVVRLMQRYSPSFKLTSQGWIESGAFTIRDWLLFEEVQP